MSSCFTDPYYFLLIASCINVLFYFIVCLPKYWEILRLVIGVDFSLMLVAYCQTIIPEVVPDTDNLPALIGFHAVFLIIYYAALTGLGDVVLGALVVFAVGPIFWGFRKYASIWTEQHFNWSLSDATVMVIIILLLLVTGVVWIACYESNVVKKFTRSLIYSILALISFRMIGIRAAGDTTFCCGTDSSGGTCPVRIEIISWFLLVILFGVRYSLEDWWESNTCWLCKKNRKKEKEKKEENERLIINHQSE